VEREIEVFQSLSGGGHPSIVRFYKALQTANNLYLFMEYCDKGDLKEFIATRAPLTGKLPEHEARFILCQVLCGLKHLKDRSGIMHRDIKLDNILVKSKVPHPDSIEHYEFKIGDMGLAKQMASSPDPTHQTMCGTPLYMAPEVITGAKYNYKADVWSLGALLFQILTGEYPFTGKNIDELRFNLKQGIYKIPNNTNLSLECIDFLNCCLKHDSKKRKSWNELRLHPFLGSSDSR